MAKISLSFEFLGNSCTRCTNCPSVRECQRWKTTSMQSSKLLYSIHSTTLEKTYWDKVNITQYTKFVNGTEKTITTVSSKIVAIFSLKIDSRKECAKSYYTIPFTFFVRLWSGMNMQETNSYCCDKDDKTCHTNSNIISSWFLWD